MKENLTLHTYFPTIIGVAINPDHQSLEKKLTKKRGETMAFSKRQVSIAFDSCKGKRNKKKAKAGRERSAAESRAFNTGANRTRRVPGKTERRIYAQS